MSSEDTKTLDFNHDKTQSIVQSHAGLESLIKKVDRCKNNPERLSTIKVDEHITCGY